jgi:ferredoxin
MIADPNPQQIGRHQVTVSSTCETFFLPHNACLSDAIGLKLTGITFGCLSGKCGICAIDVIAGFDNLSPRAESEASFLKFLGRNEASARLACQCRIRGDIVITQFKRKGRPRP